LGVDFGGTAVDGSVTLDEVFCLGNCALGPTVTVNGRLRGRVHAAELDALVADGGVLA
jgi:formate dehydrogenase subunit gamma